MANNKDRSFFKRLTQLFRSGPAVRRKIRGQDYKNFYDNQVVQNNLGYYGAAGFKREASPFSVMGAYGVLDRMSRYCLAGDMLIPTNEKDGTISIKQLAEEYKSSGHQKYYTFSYDSSSGQVKLGEILDAFRTKTDELVEVQFDNGAVLRCTKDHRIMLRDGTYTEAQLLREGDAIMPFYRKTLRKYKNGNNYRVVYCPSRGWIGEHKIVAEHILGKAILPEDRLHVHHKNFCGLDNSVSNLEVLPAADHIAMHAADAVRSSNRKAEYWRARLAENGSRAMRKMASSGMQRVQKPVVRYPLCSKPKNLNSNFDSSFSFEHVVANWEPNITLKALCQKCGVYQGKLLARIKWAGFSGYADFVRQTFDHSYLLNKPPALKFPDQLPSLQMIYSLYKEGKTQIKIAKELGYKTGYSVLAALRKGGYETWFDFTSTYENNKVAQVVFTGITEDVYDLTIRGFHNFGVIDPKTHKSCGIVHNSEFSDMEQNADIATALNVYADEACSADENGSSFHIYSDNPQIQKALEELFYDVMNIEFNDRRMIRNLPVKYDSVIPLLNGENITIQQLSNRLQTGEEIWVYSVQDKTQNVVPGKVVWCDKNYATNKITKVVFDNGSYVEAAPEHIFILRNGLRKRADELKEADSLMPYYTKISTKSDSISGYEKVYNPSSNHYKYTHRAVTENLSNVGLEPLQEGVKCVTHHKDFNKLNNHPNNLVKMAQEDHWSLHSNIAWKLLLTRPDVVKRRTEGFVRYLRSQERRDHLSEIMRGIYPEDFRGYNNSELHSTHNALRSKAMKAHWDDEKRAAATKYNMAVQFDDVCLGIVADVLKQENKYVGLKPLCFLLKAHLGFVDHYKKLNEHSKRPYERTINPSTIHNCIKRLGFSHYNVFFAQQFPSLVNDLNYKKSVKGFTARVTAPKNHKVLRVETITESCDVYCMTVVGPSGEEDRHNFAILGKKDNGTVERDGVYVANCKNGDYFCYVEVVPEHGVINVEPLPVNEVEREEGFDKHDPYAVRFRLISRGGKYLENWQMLHFRILGNDLFLPYGMCLEGTTKISMASGGVKEIRDIVCGDEVASFDTVLQRKVAAVVTGTTIARVKPCLEIKTRHNFLKTTKEHWLLTTNMITGALEYQQAGALVVGSHLVIDKGRSIKKRLPITINKPKIPALGCNKNGWFSKHGDIPNTTDLDFVRLFGFLLGDGWITNDTLYFANGIDQQQNTFYADLLRRYTGVVPRHVVGRSAKGRRCGQTCVGNKYFCAVLKTMGFVGKAKTKRIPAWVFELPYKQLRSFLLGFIDADGSVNVDEWDCARYSIELCNIELVKDLKCLAQLLGLKTGQIGYRKGSVKKICGQTAVGSGAYYFYFYDKRLKQTKKRDIVGRVGTNFVIEPIESIIDAGEYETYDIMVDSQSHNFYANGVVTHNSFLEAARRPARQLLMMEDSMLLYRLVRSPERRVFYVDVSAVHPNDIPSYMEAVKESMRGASVISQQDGTQDFRFNPLNVLDDYFLPTRPNNQTKIENIAGGQNTTAIEDVEYIHKKLIAALMVPRAYLTYDEAISSKATLAQEDIRFSRTIAHLQKIMVAELNKLAMIHLYALGFSGEDLLNFELAFSNPSTVAVQQKLALISSKIEIAAKAWELSKETGILSIPYIQKEILGLRPEQTNVIKQEARLDQVSMAELKKIAENPPFDKSIESNVDIFDKGNYEVPTSPFAPDKKEVRGIEQQNHEEERELKATREKERREKGLTSSGSPIRVNPTPNLDKSFRRSRRSLSNTGDRALVFPNFKSMLDVTKNRYSSDPFDQKGFMLEHDSQAPRIPYGLARELTSALVRMNEAFFKTEDIEVITEGEVEETDLLLSIEKELKSEE